MVLVINLTTGCRITVEFDQEGCELMQKQLESCINKSLAVHLVTENALPITINPAHIVSVNITE